MNTMLDIPSSQLPDWMRLARRGLDWGVVLVIGFSLLVAWPFIINPNLPGTNASENYIFRTADYAAAFQEGRLYPRWSPNAFGGYGAPIPHYYPPGGVYLAALIQVLFTNESVIAVRVVYVLAFCLAGSAVYALVTRRAGAPAGVLAGVLYVYSPYVGLVAPQILGDLPGVVALALLPAWLWSVDRLMLTNRPFDIFFLALACGGLFLTDALMALLGLVLVIVLVIWQVSVHDRHAPWLRVVIGCLLGICLAGFYWIPTWLEQDAVRWLMPVGNTDQLRLSDLLASLRPIDPNSIVPVPQWTLGLLAGGLAVSSGVVLLYFRQYRSFQFLFLGVGLILSIAALTVFPSETWLLGPISLCLAYGASALLILRERISPRWQRLFLPLLLILIWFTSSPIWLAPKPLDAFADTSATGQVDYERLGYGIAVLPSSEPAPSTLVEDLAFNRALLNSYEAKSINKIAPGQLSINFQAGLLSHYTHGDRFQLRVANPILLDVLTAYFPGWSATVADRPIGLRAAPDTGLIQVDVPPIASAELFITLGPTAIRAASWGIAWAALIIVLILTWGRLRQAKPFYDESILLTHPEVRLLALLFAACVTITFIFSVLPLPFSPQARPGYGLDDSILVESRSNAGLTLLSFRLNSTQYRPGEALNFTLYWQARRPLFEDNNYRVRAYVLDSATGARWNQTAWRHPGDYPTKRWVTGRYIQDTYHLALSPSMPTASYIIALEVYDCTPNCESGRALTFFDANGQVVGPVLTLPVKIAVST